MNPIRLLHGGFATFSLAALLALAATNDEGIDATTSGGDKVRLYPTGRWEYVDVRKQAEAKRIADTYPESQARPEGAQGGLFGLGRTIQPGDRDYNRGTLNPKMR